MVPLLQEHPNLLQLASPVGIRRLLGEQCRKTPFLLLQLFYFHFPHLIRWSGIGLGDIHNAFALV
ncbi:MAG: hypothetical protein ACI9HA_003463 [Dinoroseobacter sp.]|jgi:hypothetical protein